MKNKIVLSDHSNKPIVFVTVAVFLLFLLAIYARSGYEWEQFKILVFDKKFVEIMAGMAASILIGVVSSIVYSRMSKSMKERKYQKLTELGHTGLVENILSQISQYDKTCMPNYRLSIKLAKSSCGKFIKVTQSYDYRKTVGKKDELDFVFSRALSEDEAKLIDNALEQLTDNYKTHEFYFTNDDTTLIEKGISQHDLEACYSVRDLFVDSSVVPLTRGTKEGLSWSAKVNIDNNRYETTRIQYTVSFPLSFTDYLFLVLEYPAKEVTVEFDYSELLEDLDVDHVNFLGSLVGFPGSMTDSDGRISIQHDKGWLLPKSGVVFIWSPKA